MNKAILTVIGNNDPFTRDTTNPGPILTIFDEDDFETAHLLFNNEMAARAVHVRQELNKRGLDNVVLHEVRLDDPADFSLSLSVIRRWWNDTGYSIRGLGTQLSVSITSGTPAMTSALMLLVASGEMPGRLVYARRPDKVVPGAPLVVEVQVTGDEFPVLFMKRELLSAARSKGRVHCLMEERHTVCDFKDTEIDLL